MVDKAIKHSGCTCGPARNITQAPCGIIISLPDSGSSSRVNPPSNRSAWSVERGHPVVWPFMGTCKEEVLDFQLTEEQQQLKKSIRDFSEREILPHVMQWDEGNHFPAKVIKELGQMGVMGMIFPAEY